MTLEDRIGKHRCAVGVIIVLLVVGSLIVLRFTWQLSGDDTGPTVTHKLEFWIDSRGYNFSMDCDFYPSESSAVDEIAEMKFFGVVYPIRAGGVDNHHLIQIFDLPDELISLWCRVQFVSDVYSPTNPVITEIEMGITKAVSVGTYEISYLLTPFLV